MSQTTIAASKGLAVLYQWCRTINSQVSV